MNVVNPIENMQKIIAQTEAVLMATSANDQFLSLNEETQLNLLWLLVDKLREMKVNVNCLLQQQDHMQA